MTIQSVAELNEQRGRAVASRFIGVLGYLSKRRLFLLVSVTVFGLLISLGRHALKPGGLPYPSYTFVFGSSYNGDLGIFATDWRVKSPYLGRVNSGYPPFGNWIIGMTYDKAPNGPVGEALWLTTSLLLAVYFFTSLALGWTKRGGGPFVIEKEKLDHDQFQFVSKKFKRTLFLAAVLVSTCYPIIFTISRGNHEFGVLLLCFAFTAAFARESYGWAAFWLAAATASKIHPIAFGLLFLYNRKTVKYVVLAAILTVVFTIYPLVHFDGTVKENIEAMVALNRDAVGPFVVGEYGTRFNSCLLNGIRLATMWFHRLTKDQVDTLISTYRVLAPLTVLVLSLVSLKIHKSLWRRVAFPAIAMILFHQNSFDYRLILLLPPIALLMATDEETDLNAVIFTFLFGLTMIPKDYYTITSDSSVSSILNPAILLILLVLLFVTKEKKSSADLSVS